MTWEILSSLVSPTVGGEFLPEIAQQLLPVELAVRDFVQLLFQIGREIVSHIAVEEAVQEGGDQPALVFGDEALAVHAHIGAVAQGRDDRGIGEGRPMPSSSSFLTRLASE